MKNRKSLIFALCAMMGAFAYTGCADDSGNSTPEQKPAETVNLTVNPDNLTLVKGADGAFEVEYKANAEVSLKTNDNNCVTVKDAKIVLGDDKKGNVGVTAVGEGCQAKISVESDDQKKEVAVTVVGADALFLQLDKTNISLSAPGGDNDSAVVVATYSKGANGVKHASLMINNSDAECVGVPRSMETNDSGQANIDVKALKADCSAEVTVSADGNNGKIDKKFTVTVAKDGSGPEPDIVIKGDPTLTFEPASVEIEKFVQDDKHNFRLYYVDGDKQGIANAKIQLATSDASCIDLAGQASPLTGPDGRTEEGKTSFVVKKDDCTATITATTPKTDAKLEISVPKASEYDAKIALSLDSNRFDSVGYAAYLLTDYACADVGDAEKVALLGDSYNKYDDASEDINASNKPILATFDAKAIGVEKKSVLAFAKNKFQDKSILAYGCKDISISDANQTITVDLEAVPTNIIGKYDLVTNFDLTSGFEKTECKKEDTYKGLGICVPAFEDMKPGDWVQFVVNFCNQPLATLWEMIWSNTINRLLTMDGLPGWAKSILEGSGALSPKNLALSALEPYLDKILGDTGEWYPTLKKIAPDIAELATNMQLAGTLEVLEAEGVDVKKAKEEYKELQYQWSYNENNCLKGEVYGKSSCRKSVLLSKSKYGLNMSGEWNGKITLSDDAEDLLEINSHALNFKWASMLFVAVFGSILPEALGYTNTLKEDAYLKGFLSKILFEPIVKAYNADELKKATSCATEDEKKACEDNSKVCQSDKKCYNKVNYSSGKECEAFIETIVRLIAGGDLGGTASNIVQGLASTACSDTLMGKLDSLLIGDKNCDKACSEITESKVKEACEACEAKTGEEKVACQADFRKSHCGVLDTFQASTANGLNVSSKECRLYDEGTVNYMSIGKPDEPVKTAGEIFAPGSNEKTDRCTWNVDFKLSDKPVNLKGIFHAKRQQ